MSSAGTLLSELKESGYRIRLIEVQRLRIMPTPPPEVVERLKQHKSKLIAELESRDNLNYWLPLILEAPMGDDLLNILRQFRDHRAWTAERTAQVLLAVLDWYIQRKGLGDTDAAMVAESVSRLSTNIQHCWWQALCDDYTDGITSLLLPYKSKLIDKPTHSSEPLVEHYQRWRAAGSPDMAPRLDVPLAAKMFAGPGTRLFTEDGIFRFDNTVQQS